jgi:hypothetical protein
VNKISHLTFRRQAEMLRDISVLQRANLSRLALDVAVFIRTPGKADRLLATVVASAVSGPRYLADEKQWSSIEERGLIIHKLYQTLDSLMIEQ